MARSLSLKGVSTMFAILVLTLICGQLVTTTSLERRSAEERVATNEPQFVSRGGERHVREGQTIDLDCEVTDLGEFVLLWKFNRTTVLFAGNLRIHRDDRIARNDSSGALTIRDFRAENAGEYSCQVSTSPPQDILYQVLLMGPPHIKGDARAEVTAKKWDSVDLECETNAETIEWRKESRVVSSERRLRISKASPSDAGSYFCIASNEMGETQREIRFRVLYPPEVEVVSKVVHSPLGQPQIVECLVKAEPSANVNWFRKNQKVLPSDHVIVDRNDTTATLKLSSVTSEDYDEYSCVANNSLGSAVQSVLVTGKPSPPLFTSTPLGGHKTSYLLEWTLRSEAPITLFTVRWKTSESNDWKESIVEPEDLVESVKRTFAFEVTSLDTDQSYEVQVLAHNKWGVTSSDIFAFVTSWAHVTGPSFLVALSLALSVHSFQ